MRKKTVVLLTVGLMTAGLLGACGKQPERPYIRMVTRIPIPDSQFWIHPEVYCMRVQSRRKPTRLHKNLV